MPSETDGVVVKANSLEAPNPAVDAAYDIDPGIEAPKFPKDKGSDTYQGIPGDGIVPG